MREKERLEYVRQFVKDKSVEETARIWKHAAVESEAVGNWQGAIECYVNAEATGLVNCSYELSLIYTYHLPDFEKAKSYLIRSDCYPRHLGSYMGRLLTAFQKHEEALTYYSEEMYDNIRGQILDMFYQKACNFEEGRKSHNEDVKEFEWPWDDISVGGTDFINFRSILEDLLKCYNDFGFSGCMDFKSLKQVVDEIVAQNDYEEDAYDDGVDYGVYKKDVEM